MNSRDRAELAQVIAETVQPLLVTVAAEMLDEIDKSNLRLCEMLGAIFTEQAGSTVENFLGILSKQERERIEIRTKEPEWSVDKLRRKQVAIKP